MTQPQEPILDSTGNRLAGRYLTFLLGREEYGVPILNVREIIGLMDITPVPKAPEFIRGVINLRGKVITVLELRRKFGMEVVDDTSETCIIVVDTHRGEDEVQVGMLVDKVSEVLDVVSEDIDPPPRFGGDSETSFLLGTAKSRGGVKILLNVEEIVKSDEVVLFDARSNL